MEYKDFFSPKTLEKLNKKSAENLKTMLGDKDLTQTMMSSQQLLSQIAKAEAPYKTQLENLAMDMVKELYPVIDEEWIVLDAKISNIADVGKELDEIRVNKPSKQLKIRSINNRNGWLMGRDNPWGNWEEWFGTNSIVARAEVYKNYIYLYMLVENRTEETNKLKDILDNKKIPNQITIWYGHPAIKILNKYFDLLPPTPPNIDEIKVNKPGGKDLTKKEWSELINGQSNKVEDFLIKLGYPKNSRHLHVIEKNLKPNEKHQLQKILKPNLNEAISPESRRRIINAITQGAALRGTFAFYLFKEHLDDLDPSLVDAYNQIMKNSFGIYDDENAIAMMLSLLAQGHKMAGGSSKVIINEAKSDITIRARAANFPMLVHELIKGLYELISLQGFKGDKASNQAVVDKVDLLKNEPSDIRYGKFIYDALNRVFINSEYNDPRIREFFFTEVYQLEDDEFIEFIENAINEELTSLQQKWINDTLRDIASDLKADDYDATGLGEIKVNKSALSSDLVKELANELLWQLDSYYKGNEITEDTIYAVLEEIVKIDYPNLQNIPFETIYREVLNQIKQDPRGYAFINEIKINKISPLRIIKKGDDWALLADEKYIFDNYYSWDKRYTIIDAHVDVEVDDNDNEYLEVYIPEPSFGGGAPEEEIEAAYDEYETNLSIAESVLSKHSTESSFDSYKIPLNRISGVDLIPVINEIKINNPTTPENIIYRSIKQMYPEATRGNAFKKDTIFLFPNPKVLNRNSIIMDPSGTYEVYLGNDIHGRRFKNVNNLLKYVESNPVEQNTNEIKVNKPERKYFLNPEFKSWLNQDYEDIRYEFGEDVADAITMFREATQDNKTISINDIKKFLSQDEGMEEAWGDPDGYLSFIEFMDIVQDKPTTNEIKMSKSFAELFLESSNKEIKITINNNLKKYTKILSEKLLSEYSEKTIATTIERWKSENPKVDDNLAKQLIQRFDQIKSGLAQKLNIVVLPDELKQGQNYLNIDKYSFDDMVKLIKSLPENPDKVKKDAVNKFVQQGEVDKPTAQSYVARFMANKDKLKLATQEGLEDEGFTKEEVLNFIPKKLLSNNAYLDPRVWTWPAFEQMLDSLFPSQRKAEEGGENLVSTDADKIYDKNGIEIYKGDDVNKCISYNPVSPETKRKKYGWCVTQTGNTMYDSYRFRDSSPTFYFVFDRAKDSSPEHAPFKDEWHAFVIQVSSDGKEYIVTGANNRGDINTRDKGWEGIKDIVPADTWAKIKGLKDYFKPISLSSVERSRKFASGKNLSLDEFKELSQDEKIQYVQGKASQNKLAPDILKILPQYKISYEGRSTTLANIAIDNRQKFPYTALKDNEALAKRYAVVSSRYYPNDPLPLPFIKYLDEDAKQKYLEKYDDNLTFEYIEKYFGDKVAEKYVETQLKTLNYLPKSAIKYIKNDKLKQLFDIYSKLFDTWEFGSQTNISDEALENSANMPEQEINTVPFSQKQWNDLSSTERKAIIDLAEKFNKNLQYQTLLWALPFLIKDGGKTYVLLPKSTKDYQYDSWVLVDESGKVVKDNISGDSELGGQPLYLGYPSEDDDFNRIYNLKDLKIE